MNKIYKARLGSPFRVEDAQPIGEFFEKHHGKTTEQLLAIIEKERPEVICKYLEWNDHKAGRKYRLEQVRNIIQHVNLVIETKGSSEPVRAFYSVRESEKKESCIYVNLDVALTNDYMRKQVLERALNELKNWQQRYDRYVELSDLLNAIRMYIGTTEQKIGIKA